MKVLVAQTAGFCKGVKAALEITLDAVHDRQDSEEKILTFGPLIHNRQVLSMLEEKGVFEENRLENCAGKKVIIRAHGIPPQQRQKLHDMGAVILNATCKRVAKVQGIIKRYSRKGYHTIIVGDEDHAEVIGLLGYTGGQGVVIHRSEQLEELPSDWDKVLLVAQTTQNEEIFKEIRERFLKRYPMGAVENTICGSTHERQTEVKRLCSQVEAMVIVGGRHSGNTLRLAEVARECGVPTYHIETEADLNYQEMARFSLVGVSAGASTPNWIIRNVVRFLESVEPEDTDRRKNKLKRILELMAYSNVFVALGAALLSFTMEALTTLPTSVNKSTMIAFYVFAVHTLNHYLDQEAIRVNNPVRAAFYQRWWPVLTTVSLAAMAASLGLALLEGPLTFIALFFLVLMGLLYAIPIFPRSWRQSLARLKIKDIPASKTFLIPIAWASVIAVLPHLSQLWPKLGFILFGFWTIFLLVLIRTALLDLLDVQGDRLVGKETIVVLIGEVQTARLILALLFVLVCSLVLGSLMGVSTYFTYIIFASVFAYVWCLKNCHQNRLKGGLLFETLIDSVLIGTGAFSLLWVLFQPS